MKNEEIKKDESVAKLKELFVERGEEVLKTLIELFEFQEGIKFVNTKIYNLNKKE